MEAEKYHPEDKSVLGNKKLLEGLLKTLNNASIPSVNKSIGDY